jgi:hypothetical protein
MSDSTDRLIQQLLLNKSDEEAKKALISTLKRESHTPKECYTTLSVFKDNYETIDQQIKKLEEEKKLLEEKNIENQLRLIS